MLKLSLFTHLSFCTMAGPSRETDTTIWLNNKLGSTDDLWSGNSICSQLSRERLLSITDCFHTLQAHVKVKLLLAILHVSKRNIEEVRQKVWKLMLKMLHHYLGCLFIFSDK